ncbi:MAG: GFA family protein [Methyloligellaceae bacterium]
MNDSVPPRRIQGSCHCGNIRITLDWPDLGTNIPVRACGCNLCRKHGAVWTSHPDSRFDLRIADGAQMSRYRFGTQTADFHVCLTCGVVPIATCVIEGTEYAVINVNTFDDADRSELVETAADFEGETTENRLARRRRNWSPRAPGREEGG